VVHIQLAVAVERCCWAGFGIGYPNKEHKDNERDVVPCQRCHPLSTDKDIEDTRSRHEFSYVSVEERKE
jgi:hypothetical protein